MGKNILSAVLNLGFGQSQFSSGGTASNGGLWVKSIGLATSQWWTRPSPYIVKSQGDLFPWQPIPGMPNFPYGLHPAAAPDFPIRSAGYYSYQVEVSNVVRDWLDGKQPNLGFVLIGPNESTVSGSSDTALSSVATIGLDITYSVPK